MTKKRFHKLVRAMFTEHYLKGGYPCKEYFNIDIRTFTKAKGTGQISYTEWYRFLKEIYKIY